MLTKEQFISNLLKEVPTITQQQIEIITAPPTNNIKVLADAGTGKTFVLLYRLRFLLSCIDSNTSHYLILVFNKSIQADISLKLAKNNISVQTSTFDKFCFDASNYIASKKNLNSLTTNNKSLQKYLSKYFESFSSIRKLVVDNAPFILSCPFYSNIHFVLCDEAQDIIGDKLNIINAFEQRQTNIFAVGDYKQRINDWSEPIPTSLCLLDKPYSLYQLTTSFRTNNHILQQSNKVYNIANLSPNFPLSTTSNFITSNYRILTINLKASNISDLKLEVLSVVKQHPNSKVITSNNELANFISEHTSKDHTIWQQAEQFVSDFWNACMSHNTYNEHLSLNEHSLLEFYKTIKDNNSNYSKEIVKEFYQIVCDFLSINSRLKNDPNFWKDKSDKSMFPNYCNIFFALCNESNTTTITSDYDKKNAIKQWFINIIDTHNTMRATTLNKAKGLEYESVIFIDEKNNTKSTDFNAELKRLYVGTTRSKSELIVCRYHPNSHSSPISKYINKVLSNFTTQNETFSPNFTIDNSDTNLVLHQVTEDSNLDYNIKPLSGEGKTIHFIMNKWFKSGFLFSFDDIWYSSDCYIWQGVAATRYDIIKRACTKIKDIIQQTIKQGWTAYTEFPCFHYYDNVTSNFQLKKNHIFSGQIDLLFYNSISNTFRIIDIKNSLFIPSKIEDYYIIQLLHYKESIEYQHPGAIITCEFYFFNSKTGEISQPLVNQKDFDRVKKSLIIDLKKKYE